MAPEYEALYNRTVKFANALLLILSHTQGNIDPITGEEVENDTAWQMISEICKKALAAGY